MCAMHQAFRPCSAIPFATRIVPLWWLRTPSDVFFSPLRPACLVAYITHLRLLDSEETAIASWYG